MLIVEKDWSIEKVIKLAKEKKPRHIFFPFYSHILPPELYKNYECVGFHMTNLPFGRGGTPLQNLVLRGHAATLMTAFKIDGVVDGGDIYFKCPLYLDGTAEQIYARAREIIYYMISQIIEKKMSTYPQVGKITKFKRRTPKESNISKVKGLDKLYDFIRMLDAEGYPHAFLETKNLKFEFTRASVEKGYLLADVKITEK